VRERRDGGRELAQGHEVRSLIPDEEDECIRGSASVGPRTASRLHDFRSEHVRVAPKKPRSLGRGFLLCSGEGRDALVRLRHLVARNVVLRNGLWVLGVLRL
jgi:hypothetical protein